jgi:predicted metal-dependent hydrolase
MTSRSKTEKFESDYLDPSRSNRLEIVANLEMGVNRADEQSSTALSVEATSRFLAGLDLIRRGEYFAAHEELELAWRAAPQPERDFFQGLVHVAVAWYQAGRGRRIGTERQLEKAIRRLTPYAPAHRGLEVDSLLAQLRRALEVAQADRVEHTVRIDLHPVELVEEQE